MVSSREHPSLPRPTLALSPKVKPKQGTSERNLSVLALLPPLLRLLLLLCRLRRRPPPLLRRTRRRSRRRRHILNLALPLPPARLLPLGWRRLLLRLALRIGTRPLQLLRDGLLVVGRGVLCDGHGDAHLVRVPERLAVVHVLGVRVAVLVRVHLGVVQPQVVLVGLVPRLSPASAACSNPKILFWDMTYMLLRRAHGRPAPLPLLLDSLLGSRGAEVGRDDGARGLHIEEVGGEGSPGGVGVERPLLALLLGLLRRHGNGLRGLHAAEGDERGLKVNEGLVGVEVLLGRGEAQEEVGLPQVVISERPNELLNRLEAAKSLGIMLAHVLGLCWLKCG